MTNNRTQRRKQTQQRNKVVARALRNRDRTRQNLLAQGRKLARRRAENVDRDTDQSEDRGSTGASAHSTVPSTDSNEEVAVRHSHSTVPAQPRGSTVPAAARLYGLKLYEQIRADRDEDGDGPATGEADGEGEEQ